MESDTAAISANALMVFVDETGQESFADPKNPTFGRGGCAIIRSKYEAQLKRPWKTLKREYLGGANKPFHATEFERSKPNDRQIKAINRFLTLPFWRFAVMSDSSTSLPAGIDGHKAVSLVMSQFIRRLADQYDIDSVALIFEGSERIDGLVRRDFDLNSMGLKNRNGRLLEVDGYFMPKTSMEAGLEIADLVAHTAGRQRRHQLAKKDGVTLDFKQMYWHSPIPPAFMSIDTVTLQELALASSDDH